MSEANQYREYHDSIRPPDAPRAGINNLQLIASTVRLWALRTKHSLDDVLAPGFFDTVSDLRLRVEDRLECVTSLHGNAPATHSTLVVDKVNKSGGDVRVTLLHLFKRTA
jgi:hypothetical protein